MSLHSAPCNLTRFPFSACIGYSSRLWCAMHPFLAIPYAVACAFVACMPISRHAAIPHPCAPLSLALSIRRASSTFPRMQSPFSGGFRTTAALRSPLSISLTVQRSAFACPIVKEQAKRSSQPWKSMQTNQPHDRRTPVFIGVFAYSPFFYVKRTGQKAQIGAAMRSVRNFALME